MSEDKKNKLSDADYEKLGKAVEEVYLFGYSRPLRMIWFTLVRGVVYGIGLFIGGTIVVAILLSVLSHFNTVPFVNEIVNSANNSKLK